MIGRLDQKISLERKAKVRDGGGGEIHSWIALTTDAAPFARVELIGGSEGEVSGQVMARIRAKFTIRNRSDISERDRIIWNGRVWNITSLGLRTARARYQILEATAGEVA